MNNLINIKERSEKEILRLASKFAIGRSERSLEKIIALLEFIVPKENKKILGILKEALAKNHPQVQLYRRVLKEVNPYSRDKILTNLIIQGFILNQRKREAVKKEGSQAPFTILISPTMRCNLSCVGCYAGNYTKSDDLKFDLVDRVIQEGKEAGVAFFQVYTNGTLITDDIAEKLVKLGNVMPMISIEGFEKETDQRRGKGVYKKVIKAMAILQKHKVPFGCSMAVTPFP